VVIAELREDALLARSLTANGPRGARWPLALAWAGSPGLRLLAAHRLAHHFERPRPSRWHRRWPFLAAKVVVVIARQAALVATKSEITPDTPIGGGVALSDRGHIIVGARHIGGGTVIHERVTIGMDIRREVKPTIGSRVWISPNCVVYGDITVGDDVTLMPRTVLSRSVPAGAVVEGNPGRVVSLLADHLVLRRRLLESPTVTAADLIAQVT
jgi:serine acetyltransferase